jgi:hypothetical protein
MITIKLVRDIVTDLVMRHSVIQPPTLPPPDSLTNTRRIQINLLDSTHMLTYRIHLSRVFLSMRDVAAAALSRTEPHYSYHASRMYNSVL